MTWNQYILLPLKRYAEFNGRSCRSEFWPYFLLVCVLSFILEFLLHRFELQSRQISAVFESSELIVTAILYLILVMALVIPTIAVAIRRLHDTDKSGWWLLIIFIPFVGGIIFLILAAMEGTEGENRFGPDPHNDNQSD